MEVSQLSLARMLFACLLSGIALAIIYDLVRLTHLFLDCNVPSCVKKIKEKAAVPQALHPLAFRHSERSERVNRIFAAVIIALEDILFAILASVVLILTVYLTADGQFRLITLLVQVAGFFIYIQTAGRLTLPVYGTAVMIVRAGILWLLALVSYLPIRLMLWLHTLLTPLYQRIRGAVRQWLTRVKGILRKRKHQPQSDNHCERKPRPVPDGKHVFCFGKSRQP